MGRVWMSVTVVSVSGHSNNDKGLIEIDFMPKLQSWRFVGREQATWGHSN